MFVLAFSNTDRELSGFLSKNFRQGFGNCILGVFRHVLRTKFFFEKTQIFFNKFSLFLLFFIHLRTLCKKFRHTVQKLGCKNSILTVHKGIFRKNNFPKKFFASFPDSEQNYFGLLLIFFRWGSRNYILRVLSYISRFWEKMLLF